MKLNIRMAHPDDRLNLSELKRRASLVGETGNVLQSLLEDPALTDIDEELLANNEVIVAEIGATIVGFVSLSAQDGNDAEIQDMFVEPSLWRKGIGRELMYAAERKRQPGAPHACMWSAIRMRWRSTARWGSRRSASRRPSSGRSRRCSPRPSPRAEHQAAKVAMICVACRVGLGFTERTRMRAVISPALR